MKVKKLTILKSRCLAAVFAVFAVISLIMIPGINAHAIEGTSGSVGDVDYSFNEATGKLTITVTSGRENFKEIVIAKNAYTVYESKKEDYPWNSFRSKIKSVVIADKVTHIGANAFKDCTNLESITLPDSVEYILYNAFESTGLKSFKVPKKLVGIYNNTFKDCTSLKSVDFEGYNPNVKDSWIGYDAFNGCTSLESIKIPRQIFCINDYAFSGCTKLENLEFEEKKAGEEGSLWIQDYVFDGCTSLTRVEFAGHVEQIGYLAFQNCTSLEYVKIKEGSEKWSLLIYDDAFKGCNALKNMYIPKRLNRFAVPFGDDNKRTVFHIYAPSKIYIFLKENGFDYEFQNGGRCGTTDETELKWYYDSEAKELVIEGNGAMKDFPGVDAPWNTVAKNAEKITINAGCVSIGENAFFNLTKVKEVSMGNTVKTIGEGAFAGETALETVVFSNSLVSIGAEAFSGCSALTSVEIPNSTESVGNKAFYNCTALNELTVPDSVTNIGTDIVKNTSDDLEIKTTDGSAAADYAEKIGAKTTAKSTATIKAEKEAKAKAEAEAKAKAEAEAKAKAQNSDKTTEKKNNTDVKKAPAKGTALKKGNLKYKVTKAGSFTGKTGTVTVTGATKKTVKKITIPASIKVDGITYKVTAIKAKAFKGYKKLTKATIGKNVKTIGKSAFDGASNLKNIKINTTKLTKKSVGAKAFNKINSKANIKVSAKKLKSYKKILKAKGVKGKKQTITK